MNLNYLKYKPKIHYFFIEFWRENHEVFSFVDESPKAFQNKKTKV